MPAIGILSDTHGTVNPQVAAFFRDVDEIWHAGDMGSLEVPKRLQALKPLRGVYGNIDSHDVRLEFPEVQCFDCGGIRVLMTHIGGYPGKYERRMKSMIEKERPGLFISGHSHILKVMYDKHYGLLHINPGAAGNSGMHRSVTAVRLILEDGKMRDLEVLDIPRFTESL